MPDIQADTAAAVREEAMAAIPTLSSQEQAEHWKAAGRHRSLVGSVYQNGQPPAVLPDVCAAAEAYAAASEDYVRASLAFQAAGDAEAAFQCRELAADAATNAARMYEQCAMKEEATGDPRRAREAWRRAQSYWERVWLFFDRVRRYWVIRKMRAYNEDDPNRTRYEAEEGQARDRSFEGERGARRAQERAARPVQ